MSLLYLYLTFTGGLGIAVVLMEMWRVGSWALRTVLLLPLAVSGLMLAAGTAGL